MAETWSWPGLYGASACKILDTVGSLQSVALIKAVASYTFDQYDLPPASSYNAVFEDSAFYTGD